MSTPLAAAAATCSASGCMSPAVAQWRRRPTAAELDAVVAAEQAQRQRIIELSGPDGAAPVFGPLPTVETCTKAVYGCVQHLLGLDLAARIHTDTCLPDPARLPGCGCTPEPLPATPVPPSPAPLPSGWVVSPPSDPSPEPTPPASPTTAPTDLP